MADQRRSRQRGDTATLLPLVADSGNRRMLTDWITSHDRYELTEERPDTAMFDLCVLDTEMLEREATTLTARKRETSMILPVLLLVPDTQAGSVHTELRQERPALWDLVDGMLRMPVREYELADKVDTLLQLRTQSETLTRQREQLQIIRDKHAGHGVVITDIDGRIEYVNTAFEKQSGYTSEEVLGRTPRLLKSGEHDKAFYEDLWETITSGDVWHGEMTNQGKDGGQYVIDQTIAPVTGPDNEIERFIAVNHDITELKDLELSLRERSEQLEILNRVLRHDIRNDMTVVLGWLDYVADHCEGELESELDRIESSAERVVELTTAAGDIVKTMGSDAEPDLEPISLTQILLEEGKKRQEVFEDATIELPVSPPCVTVAANELLSSVFRNLINNAVKHNDVDEPVVSITVRETDDRVQVRVADNGPGVPETIKDDIFDDELKGLESSGTGMGLYLVSTLVDLYGGEVWVEDNDPTGAVFCVELDVLNQSMGESGEYCD
ncbi:Signal transduction histidine kinase, contains PAS domain [Halapricum desulfuricans]|uniref:histidine kinase n=2 Tax=Halapricum desulfuricans TaxID=2841257 RepID=A0A897NKT0_9EURY|nr:Signal transduction histidine kinase, contains PAS domain [Halapricum desulfuricans]